MVGYDDLMAVLEQDKIVVEAGDLVCFRTGFDNLILEMDGRPTATAWPLLRGARRAGRAASAMGDR